eukprot:scaffold90640_cov35-Attheya_sp.AAC.1
MKITLGCKLWFLRERKGSEESDFRLCCHCSGPMVVGSSLQRSGMHGWGCDAASLPWLRRWWCRFGGWSRTPWWWYRDGASHRLMIVVALSESHIWFHPTLFVV